MYSASVKYLNILKLIKYPACDHSYEEVGHQVLVKNRNQFYKIALMGKIRFNLFLLGLRSMIQ